MSDDIPLDSAVGIEKFITWARAHRAVLNEVHRNLAIKYGVSTDGVLFARAIDIAPDER